MSSPKQKPNDFPDGVSENSSPPKGKRCLKDRERKHEHFEFFNFSVVINQLQIHYYELFYKSGGGVSVYEDNFPLQKGQRGRGMIRRWSAASPSQEEGEEQRVKEVQKDPDADARFDCLAETFPNAPAGQPAQIDRQSASQSVCRENLPAPPT
jgi:hypothetical protein